MTQAGTDTFWDRSTLYALRGVYSAGARERAMEHMAYYSQQRLLGEHVPYPIEAWPEGNQRHLSAESALYCRIVTEGIPYNALPQAVKMSFENSEYASWKRDDIDKLERTGVETVFVIEVEKQNQEVDLYYSADGTLIKSIVDTDDDNSEHLPVQLTEAMKNFINEKYPNARIMEVDVEDDRNDWDFGFTEVDIIHNGISKDVLFNQTGNWYSTSWEIRQNELPEAVNNTLNNQYGEYRFDEAEYIEKADGSIYYRIELEKGDVDKVVNIGENGTVLS